MFSFASKYSDWITFDLPYDEAIRQYLKKIRSIHTPHTSTTVDVKVYNTETKELFLAQVAFI